MNSPYPISKAVVLLALALIAVPVVSRQQVNHRQGIQPPPPPPPGALGGTYTTLPSSQIGLFNGGYSEFNIKWDPIRGLGPVFTEPGCFNCHGGGLTVISTCVFNPPGVPCIAGGSSNITNTVYGKFNPDGTFNYLDGAGTFPENEGGPIIHLQTVAQFGTLATCSSKKPAASPNGSQEVGSTVTINTTVDNQYLSGQRVQVTNNGVSGYNGIFTITSIINGTEFTYTDPITGLASSGGGIVNNMPGEVMPTDATVFGAIRSPDLYGLGLIDSIPESTILANSGVSKGLGITGFANMVPDQNSVLHAGRFGQKAAVPNLEMFVADAFNNELGITNAFFPVQHLPQGQPFPAGCAPDTNNPEDVNGIDLIKTYQFVELLAPAAPAPPTTQTEAGQVVFESIGCNLCHIQSMTTGPNIKLALDLNGDLSAVIPPLSNATANLYSDLLVHDMGSGDSGGVPFQPEQEGQASLTQWRTAPLWGLSQRVAIGLMHDNLSKTISAAILRHGGEASQVIAAYQALSSTDQSNLLAFLGSL